MGIILMLLSNLFIFGFAVKVFACQGMADLEIIIKYGWLLVVSMIFGYFADKLIKRDSEKSRREWAKLKAEQEERFNEKQIPKKPILINRDTQDEGYICPTCNHGVYCQKPYCFTCGQKLDYTTED